MKFVVQISKGIIHDRQMRRKTMFVVMLAALAFVFAGVTFLEGPLRDQPIVFLIFWVSCGWLTLLALLLALYDMLAMRVEAARARKNLKAEIFGKHDDKES
jgi:hypothetical protein